jgi:hypothetical protein
VEVALAAAREQTGVDEALQVMAQRRRGKVDMLLDLASGRPFGAALNNEPKNGKTNGMAEGAELLGVTIELGRHGLLLTKSNQFASDHFEKIRITQDDENPRHTSMTSRLLASRPRRWVSSKP